MIILIGRNGLKTRYNRSNQYEFCCTANYAKTCIKWGLRYFPTKCYCKAKKFKDLIKSWRRGADKSRQHSFGGDASLLLCCVELCCVGHLIDWNNHLWGDSLVLTPTTMEQIMSQSNPLWSTNSYLRPLSSTRSAESENNSPNFQLIEFSSSKHEIIDLVSNQARWSVNELGEPSTKLHQNDQGFNQP